MEYRVRMGGRDVSFTVDRTGGSSYRVETAGGTLTADLTEVGLDPLYSLLLDGKSYQFFVQEEAGGLTIIIGGERYPARVFRGSAAAASAAVSPLAGSGRQQIAAPMPGVIIEVLVAVGDKVEPKTPLIVVESMKMNNQLRATGPGTVTAINVQAGQRVERGQVLVVLE